MALDLVRIAVRVAGKTLDMVYHEGYRDKAMDALKDLDDQVHSWVHSHRPVSEESDVEQFLSTAVISKVLAKFGLPEVNGENTEHSLHEAEHVLIDDSFKLQGKRGEQTSKSKADALMDEVAISMLARNTDYDNPHRLADVIGDLARSLDSSVPMLQALESVKPSDGARQKAWRTALQRAAREDGSALSFAQALIDTFPVDRDPIAREVEERMRAFYAQLTARVSKARKDFQVFAKEVESQPGWRERRDRERSDYQERDRKRLRDEGLSEEEIAELV